jgi:hypothetical protein
MCVQDEFVDDEDDDDCSTHYYTCSCEDCMQTYPERFYVDEKTGEWENIHEVEEYTPSGGWPKYAGAQVNEP